MEDRDCYLVPWIIFGFFYSCSKFQLLARRNVKTNLPNLLFGSLCCWLVIGEWKTKKVLKENKKLILSPIPMDFVPSTIYWNDSSHSKSRMNDPESKSDSKVWTKCHLSPFLDYRWEFKSHLQRKKFKSGAKAPLWSSQLLSLLGKKMGEGAQILFNQNQIIESSISTTTAINYVIKVLDNYRVFETKITN